MTDYLALALGADPRKEFGLCRQVDADTFFPDKGGSTKEAKRICGLCEVRGECLQYALDHEERFGIWGGLSERDRRKLRRRGGQPTSPPVTPNQAPSTPDQRPAEDEPSQSSARRVPAGSHAARGTPHPADPGGQAA
jgi:WhiB family transcriptional regulator, redox-sensing transcriptional regulator